MQAIAAGADKKKGTMSSSTATPIEAEILDKLKYGFGKVKNIEPHDVYLGTAWSAREHLIDAFENTHAYWE